MNQHSIRLREDQERYLEQESIQLSKFVRRSIDDRIDRDMWGICYYSTCGTWVPNSPTESNVIHGSSPYGEVLDLSEDDTVVLCDEHLEELVLDVTLEHSEEEEELSQ